MSQNGEINKPAEESVIPLNDVEKTEVEEEKEVDKLLKMDNCIKMFNDNGAKGDSADTKIQNQDEEYANKIQDLKQELQKTTSERDSYHKKLGEMEKKLTDLQNMFDNGTNTSGDEVSLRIEMEDLKNKLTQTQLQLGERIRMIVNQENQINALNKQVSSLKEVVQITKDLLNIRNMEVKHLQNDVDSMESKISAEKERHNIMLTKMDAAVRLNEDLKKEYETQLRLFQDLRIQYDRKVALLSEENKALGSANAALKSSL